MVPRLIKQLQPEQRAFVEMRNGCYRLGFTMLGVGFLTLTVPPFFLNKTDVFHRWLQGLALSGAIASLSTAAWQGTKALKLEPLATSEKDVETEGYLHLLSSSLAYEEQQRERLIDKLLKLNPAKLEEPSEPQLNFYNLKDDLEDEAGGILILGRNGAGKTSTARQCAGILTQRKPAEVIVLDPHFNEIWPEAGLQSIGEIAAIERAIDSLLDELDQRCIRKQNKQPLGNPIIIITDEIQSCLHRFSDPKRIEQALTRFGCEGRKFDMLYCGICHSANVNDIGISAALRANYFLINLCTAANNIANFWPDDDRRKEWVKSQAYPCIVSGCVEPTLCLHPTHSGYPKFKKKGLPPQGLLPINQLPWSVIDINGQRLISTNNTGVNPGVEFGVNTSPNTTNTLTNTNNQHQLELLFNKEFSDLTPLTPDWVKRDPLEDITPDVRAAVLRCYRANWSQTKTCESVWDVTKGSSKKWSAAVYKYKEILGDYEKD